MLAYQTAVIEQISTSLAKVFNDSYPDTLLQAPYVGPDYPLTKERFPSIIVTYEPSRTINLGMGHYTTVIDDQTGEPVQVQQYRFEGQVTFKIVALSTIDAIAIADQVVELLSFGKIDTRFQAFWKEIVDNDFISITLLTNSLTMSGKSEVPSPWGDTDVSLYETTVTCGIVGEFESETFSSGIVRISGVNLLPYRPDQNPPAGTGDPNAWQ